MDTLKINLNKLYKNALTTNSEVREQSASRPITAARRFKPVI